MASKAAKKAKTFLTERGSAKRLKALNSFIQIGTDEEVHKLYYENGDIIVAVLSERLSELDSSSKKGKNAVSDVTPLFDCAKVFAKHVPTNLQQAKYFQPIFKILERGLAKSNKTPVRISALTCLISIIDCLDINFPLFKDLFPLFAAAVNLSPLLDDNTMDKNALVLASSPPTIEEIAQSFECLLDFIEKSTKKSFGFWYDLLKQHYFIYMYYDVLKHLSDGRKIKPISEIPEPIQKVIVAKIDVWFSMPKIAQVIASEENTALLYNILSKVCSLSMQYSSTIQNAISSYYSYFMSLKKAETTSFVEAHIRHFVKNVSEVFKRKQLSTEHIPIHVTLCNDTLALFLGVSARFASEKETWECIQNTLLDIVYQQLRATSPFAFDTSTPQIAVNLVKHLFIIWLRSPITTESMWKNFTAQMTALTNWIAVVNAWRTIFLKLGAMIIETNYPKLKKEDYAVEEPVGDIFTRQTDAEVVKQKWFIILNSLGNICQISEPENFADAVKALNDTIDMFVLAEDSIPIQEEVPFSLCNQILVWLFESCAVDVKKNRGKLIAYTALCKFFCRLRMTAAPIELLSHFYRALQIGIKSSHTSVVWLILRKASNIFFLGLPGCSILVPEIVMEVTNTLRPDNKAAPPEDVQQHAVKLLSSIICFVVNFSELEFLDPTTQQKLKKDELLNQLIATFLLCLQNEAIVPTVKASCLRYLCVVAFEEIYYYKRIDFVQSCIRTFIQHLLVNNKLIVEGALECLGSLAVAVDEITQMDPNLIKQTVSSLASNILHWMSKDSPLKDDFVSSMFLCLAEYLTVVKTNILAEKSLAESVFHAIELGLNYELAETPATQVANNPQPQKKKGFFSSNKETKEEAKEPTKPATPIFNKIKEAAEMLLAVVMNSYNQYPTESGCEQIVSYTGDVEAEAKRSLFFIYESSAIIGISETQAGGDRTVSFTVRNSTGKFVWESKFVPLNSVQEGIVEYQIPLEAPGEIVVEAPVIKPDPFLQVIEMFSNGQSPDALYVGDKNLTGKDKVDEYRLLLEAQHITTASVQPSKRELLPLRLPVPTPTAEFHNGRLLLAHLGLLNPQLRSRLVPLDQNDQKVIRCIRELDRVFSRESIKIGIVYVKEGQETQAEILSNESCSQQYADFVSGLGWTVDLETHEGFLGGLDKTAFTAGKTAPYYANALNEVIFHELTKMPISKTDTQQVARKRHIANDSVNIVWCEHKKNYRVETIVTQFNDAIIILYPIERFDLFRVHIHQKDKIPPFGPLQDGMVVDKRLLPLLVRLTGINANRACRSICEGYKKPTTVRAQAISDLASRTKPRKTTFDEYYGKFFLPPQSTTGDSSSSLESNTAQSSAISPPITRKSSGTIGSRPLPATTPNPGLRRPTSTASLPQIPLPSSLSFSPSPSTSANQPSSSSTTPPGANPPQSQLPLSASAKGAFAAPSVASPSTTRSRAIGIGRRNLAPPPPAKK